MRTLAFAVLTIGFVTAQTSESLPPRVLLGRLIAVSGDSIEVQDSLGTHLLFCDKASIIWRGRERHDFTALQVGDEVSIRYRIDSTSRAVVMDLSANIEKVEGRIAFVGASGFQVDENYSAPLDSGYRRGLRDILYDSDTTWEDSIAQDLKIGRDVFVIGLKLPGGLVQATRVIVYERGAPVRAKTSRIMPNGRVR